MKIRKNVKIHEVAGEHIILRMGDGKKVDMTTVIGLNESSLFLLNKLMDIDFEVDDVVRLLTGEYEVGESEARSDAEKWICELDRCFLLER